MSITTDIDRLVKMFEEAERYILKLIADLLQQNPQARSRLFWYRRAQAVHGELARIRAQLLKQTPDVIGHSYKAGFTAVTDQHYSTGINQRAVALLAAGMNDKLDAALVTVGRRVDDSFRRAGLRAAAYHAIAGTSKQMAAKHMTQQLQKDGTTGFVDKAGRQWSLGTYTSMVIRTTTREAMSQGTYNGLVQTDHELVKVSHHINSCPICIPYDGNTYCLPGASEDLQKQYPVLLEMPPFHPNCKHSIGPASEEFDIIEAKLLAAYGNG